MTQAPTQETEQRNALGEIKPDTPLGTRFEFEIIPGGIDPRTQNPAKMSDEFTLELENLENDFPTGQDKSLVPRAVRFKAPPKGMAGYPAGGFTMKIDHWRKVWQPCITGRLDPEEPGSRQQAPGTPAGTTAGTKQQAGAQPSLPAGRSEIPPPRAELVLVPISAIDSADPIRGELTPADLLPLAKSMHDVGLLEPVIVSKPKQGDRYCLIAGHRRVEAARSNGESFIEARVYGPLDARTFQRMRLVENLQRRDLNHMQIADQFGQARDAGMSIAEIAAEVSLSDDYVRKHIELLRLAQPVRELLASGRLPLKQAELIARVGDHRRQIDLAGNCVNKSWQVAKGNRWKEYGDMGGQDDHVMTMDRLREEVGRAMLSLAACGWCGWEGRCGQPWGTDATGRKRGSTGRMCAGCPDNSATHLEQPALFAGVNPRGSPKRGHCTNETCYAAKATTWSAHRQREKNLQAKKRAKLADAARKKGLDVCDACPRIAGPDEHYKTHKPSGQKLCPKCTEKARNAVALPAEVGGRGAKARKFPEKPDEKYAVALYEYAIELRNRLAQWVMGAPEPWPSALGVSLALVKLGQSSYSNGIDPDRWEKLPSPKLKEMLAQIDDPKRTFGVRLEFVADVISAIGLEMWRPLYSAWSVNTKVENVPLPPQAVGVIDCMEHLARRWEMKGVPTRPSPGDFEPKPATDKKPTPPELKGLTTIRTGNKEAALAALASWKDAEALCKADAAGLQGDWRRAAVRKRIKELLGPPKPTKSAKAKKAGKSAKRKTAKKRSGRRGFIKGRN